LLYGINNFMGLEEGLMLQSELKHSKCQVLGIQFKGPKNNAAVLTKNILSFLKENSDQTIN